MKHSEEYIENRLKWRGKKNGLPKKNSIFFDDLCSVEKKRFTIVLGSKTIGKPVILFKGKNNRWTIFGTNMIASGSDQSFDTVRYSNIDEHTIGDDPLGVFSSKEPTKLSLFLFRLKKFKQDKILVRKKDGIMMTLYGPKGEDVFDMHNIMIMLERMAKS